MAEQITVRYFNLIKKVTERDKEKIKIEEGCTINDIVRILIKKYGSKLESYIFDKNSKLNPYLRIVHNGKLLTDQDLDNKLSNDDMIEIFISPVGG